MIKLHSSKPPNARKRRRRSVGAFVGAAAVLGVLIGIFGWYEFDQTAKPVNWGEVGMLTVLGIVLIFLLVEGGVSAGEAKILGRIERGEGVLARWTVDAQSWRELWERRRSLDEKPGALRSYPTTPAEAPPGGVEIVISEGWLFIGPEFRFPLPPISVLPVRLADSWLELDCLEDIPDHVLRVPVPTSAMPAVERFLLRVKDGQEVRSG